MPETYRLVMSCQDRVGIISTVTRFIAENGGWIIEASQHADVVKNWFFMRYVIRADSLPFGIEEFRNGFSPIGEYFKADWRITDARVPKQVVLMVSREDHCLTDLIYRWRSNEMEFEIACVVSNHENFRAFVEWYGIPYHYVPIPKGNRQTAFDQISHLMDIYAADVVVLARYMQILPPELCVKYAGRVINIHHSFLPSFVGAKPYHKAFERGVKLVGATCHYVTEELDAGPIIEQDVVRVSHDDTVEDLIRLGRDVEKFVLARGLRYHLEDRVLTLGNKTVVFD